MLVIFKANFNGTFAAKLGTKYCFEGRFGGNPPIISWMLIGIKLLKF